jgi:hypothetical protein
MTTYTVYPAVDDPQLLIDARASLKAQYPTLTDNDLDNLQGDEAVRLYMLGRGEDPGQATG